jgi:hypothetical protein
MQRAAADGSVVAATLGEALGGLVGDAKADGDGAVAGLGAATLGDDTTPALLHAATSTRMEAQLKTRANGQ